MKIKSKKTFLLICSITLIAAIGIVGFSFRDSFAAFISSGYHKGVSLLSEYYFSSNILSSIESEADIQNRQYRVVSNSGNDTRIDVQIRNYDAQMKPDTFDITFTLEIWLDKEPAAGFTYSVVKGETVVSLMNTSDTQRLEQTIIIEGNGDPNPYDFTIICHRDDETDIKDASAICIMASPTKPSYMSTYRLGAMILLTNEKAAFSVTGNFDTKITDGTSAISAPLADYAGFLYVIATSGSLGASETASVTLEWDTLALEIDTGNPLYLKYPPTVDAINHKATMSFPVGTGDSYQIAFYRAQQPAEPEEGVVYPDWSAATGGVTREKLDTYITFTPVIPHQ